MCSGQSDVVERARTFVYKDGVPQGGFECVSIPHGSFRLDGANENLDDGRLQPGFHRNASVGSRGTRVS